MSTMWIGFASSLVVMSAFVFLCAIGIAEHSEKKARKAVQDEVAQAWYAYQETLTHELFELPNGERVFLQRRKQGYEQATEQLYDSFGKHLVWVGRTKAAPIESLIKGGQAE